MKLLWHFKFQMYKASLLQNFIALSYILTGFILAVQWTLCM